MRIFLIGPALLGTAHVAGSIFSDDAQQLVHKRPALVYADVSKALAISPQGGTIQLEGGKPVPYRLTVDRTPSDRLVVHFLLSGREAGQVQLDFRPENDGRDTRMVARVESDGKVVREELAGTDKAKLGYAPDWLLTFAFGRSLKEAAKQIEQNSLAFDPTSGFNGGAEPALTADEQRQHDKWRQYQASRPTTDPNAAADAYLGR